MLRDLPVNIKKDLKCGTASYHSTCKRWGQSVSRCYEWTCWILITSSICIFLDFLPLSKTTDVRTLPAFHFQDNLGKAASRSIPTRRSQSFQHEGASNPETRQRETSVSSGRLKFWSSFLILLRSLDHLLRLVSLVSLLNMRNSCDSPTERSGKTINEPDEGRGQRHESRR